MLFPYNECESCDNLDIDWFGQTCTVVTKKERKPNGERCIFYESYEEEKKEKEQE